MAESGWVFARHVHRPNAARFHRCSSRTSLGCPSRNRPQFPYMVMTVTGILGFLLCDFRRRIWLWLPTTVDLKSRLGWWKSGLLTPLVMQNDARSRISDYSEYVHGSSVTVTLKRLGLFVYVVPYQPQLPCAWA
jgi:hypothetical protein